MSRVVIQDDVTGGLLGVDASGRLVSNPPSGWSAVSAPATGSQATANKAAAVGKVHVCESIVVSWAASVAPAATKLEVFLRDGATGAGAVLLQFDIFIPAAVGGGQIIIPGLSIDGTAGNAMTLEFSAGLANVDQRVTLVGFDR